LWSRSRREERRQKVLDELLELDPEARPGRLQIAVAAGDVRGDEVDEALRLVHRLDELRVMTIPPSALLPGGIVPIVGYPVPEQKPTVTGVPIVSVDVVEAASLRITADLAARRARAGARSSRQRRLRLAAGRAPAGEPAAVGVAQSAHEESWPSIEWLRP
jgi:hypothetical protein